MDISHTKSICIVTPTYISSNPRVVKEADALWQAGFRVKVVFSQGNNETARYFDETLLKGKPWKWYSISWSPSIKGEKLFYYKAKLRFHLARRLPSVFFPFAKLAEYAEGRVYRELAIVAASEKADIYIGHYPAGLAAAGYAAFCWRAKLGYDVEDLHISEQSSNKEGKRQTKRIIIIENRYLPKCSYVTVVSELVADELVKRYKIVRPIVIHNVFPWSERQKIDGQIKDRKGSNLSLYWYSQVIGDDRGIEDAIRACGLLREKVQIHLRGYLSPEVKNKFLNLARTCGVEKNLYFHPQVPPTELLSRATEHDVGLALEQPISLNRSLTVSNKFFFYMLAGLTIAVTDLPGQRNIISTCPDAGFLYASGDYWGLAEHLNRLLQDPKLLQSYKQAALKAAQRIWNWERESITLVRTINKLLSK